MGLTKAYNGTRKVFRCIMGFPMRERFVRVTHTGSCAVATISVISAVVEASNFKFDMQIVLVESLVTVHDRSNIGS